MIDTLPDFDLDPARPLGAAFSAVGARRFREAARFVNALPYGRTADRADYRRVLPERRGTCSTKHALLAALAAECGAPVRLVLGVYLMDPANTPGVGPVLRAAGLGAVPEAHCYLAHGGARVDLTWPGRIAAPPAVVQEEAIQPHQVGAFKVRRHRQYVEAWAGEQGLDGGRVWSAREACIAALGASGSTTPGRKRPGKTGRADGAGRAGAYHLRPR